MSTPNDTPSLNPQSITIIVAKWGTPAWYTSYLPSGNSPGSSIKSPLYKPRPRQEDLEAKLKCCFDHAEHLKKLLQAAIDDGTVKEMDLADRVMAKLGRMSLSLRRFAFGSKIFKKKPQKRIPQEYVFSATGVSLKRSLAPMMYKGLLEAP